MEGRQTEAWHAAERAKVVKHDDKEGKMEGRQAEKWAPGERAPVVKRPDNLHQEGQMQGRQVEKWSPGETADVVKRHDNLHMEGEFSKKTEECGHGQLIVYQNPATQASVVKLKISLTCRKISFNAILNISTVYHFLVELSFIEK